MHYASGAFFQVLARWVRAVWVTDYYRMSMRERPVIGVCSALERAQWSVWDLRAALIPYNYIEAIQRAGGVAILLPPDPAAVERPDQMLNLVDGLMLAGGADINPRFYGQAMDPATEDTVPERDQFEIALTTRAIERDLPILGICRGMQMINVVLGGTLLQDVPGLVGHTGHRAVTGTFEGADHDVDIEPGSATEQATGETAHATKSHHHQAVDRLGEGLVITGRSRTDGLPESIELPGKRFVLGVQLHPEADERSKVIAALVQACR